MHIVSSLFGMQFTSRKFIPGHLTVADTSSTSYIRRAFHVSSSSSLASTSTRGELRWRRHAATRPRVVSPSRVLSVTFLTRTRHIDALTRLVLHFLETSTAGDLPDPDTAGSSSGVAYTVAPVTAAFCLVGESTSVALDAPAVTQRLTLLQFLTPPLALTHVVSAATHLVRESLRFRSS